ncbi:hypothetical protein CA54_25830 [Symmachiella macrocystis]|uniref:Uncharacterized protein n=1 Tax=Symmachiella macrocystis TaxID=2527985 RepID=A0A5C6BNX2_9PLAN|nr:hypothetical protein [Symmachiella macrocystis]TWU13748.1 hypothetical protein CA54_25830 [Symmachiella macrocystis]
MASKHPFETVLGWFSNLTFVLLLAFAILLVAAIIYATIAEKVRWYRLERKWICRRKEIHKRRRRKR